jgi:TolA-binding protein
MKCVKLIMAFSILLIFIICPLFGDDVKVWSVQVFSSKDSSRSNAFATELRSKGYSPVSVIQNNDRYSISVGEFKCYTDVVYYRKSLRQAEFKNAFITSRILTGDASLQSMTNQNLKTEAVFVDTNSLSVENPLYGRKIISPEIVSSPVITPPTLPEIIMNAENDTLGETDLLKKAYALGREANISASITAHQDLIRLFPESKNLPDSSLSIANLKLKQGNLIEAKTAYENVISQFPGKNHAGKATLRLAYLKMREKDSVAAKILFQSISSGNVTASVEVKREAEERLSKLDRRDKIKNDPAYILLHQAYGKLTEEKTVDAESLYQDVINTHPLSEAAGEASLRLAYMKLTKAKESTVSEEAEVLRSGALSYFESVARGDIKAEPDHQLEAMNRCAKIYHSRKERIRSLQAYREIARFTDADGTLAPEVHVAMAGLYMELAGCGKGSFDDCITECDRILVIEGASDHCYSTASVMKGESLYLQKKYDECLKIMSGILIEYPHKKRPAMMAQLHIGAVYFVKKDYVNARKEFQKVIDNFTDADNWRKTNIRGNALVFLARVDMAEKKFKSAEKYFKQVYINYPDTKEANQAEKYLGRYYPQIWENIKRREEVK